MDVLSNIAKSYEKYNEKWINKISENLSTYVDNRIDRFLSKIKGPINNPKLIFGMGTWVFCDSLGVSLLDDYSGILYEETEELEDFLETISNIVQYSDPFPGNYIGKYCE